MKKVLFVATVDSHIRHFHIPYLKYFHDRGFEVHVATSDDESEQFDYCDVKHKICMERSPYNMNNLKAIKQMKELIKKEQFDIIHCHTPMGSVVTRLAVKKLRKEKCANDMQVIYTAHGFHFYKGAPIINWIIYYPIEKWLSKYTDKLITINEEDCNAALKFKANKVYKVNGVGVDERKFDAEISNDDVLNLKKEIGISDEDFVISCIGEINKNKNQKILIEAASKIINKGNSNVKVLLIGDGVLLNNCKEKIRSLNLENIIICTGYRSDVSKILKITNLLVSCSKREGLPINVIEALQAGVPVLASNIRGNRDIISDEKNGLLFNVSNTNDLTEKLEKIINDKELYNALKQDTKKSAEKYMLKNVLAEMEKIYNE